MPDIIEKLPPQSLEAERSVLGALLLDKEVFYKIADILQPDDFYKDAHRYVYESVIDLSNKNEVFDILTVSARLEEKTQLEKIGGRAYLAELTNSVPSTANAVNYARIVHRKATLRRLLHAANNIMELGYHEEDDLEEILDNAQREVFGVSQTYLSQTFLPIRSVLADAFERIDELHRQKGKLRGIPTGFPAL
ncbi:MAG: DnaB-like helicase N-terminal domain-containing protein, partial [Patescibacteria group bacterium]